MWGEAEEDCALRLVLAYGSTRAITLAEVYKSTAKGPMRAYYWRVEGLIADMTAGDGN